MWFGLSRCSSNALSPSMCQSPQGVFGGHQICAELSHERIDVLECGCGELWHCHIACFIGFVRLVIFYWDPKKSYVSHPVHIKSPRSVIDYANKNHTLFDLIEFVKILQLNNQRCRDDKITFRSINCQEWLGVRSVKRKRWS